MKNGTTLVILGIFMFAGACWAQTSSQGTIYGTVRDISGAVIPSAQLTIVNESTGLTRHASTNSQGDYRVDFLPPGKYQVTFQKEGFKTFTITDTALLVGQVLKLDTTLSVGSTKQKITVRSSAVPLNTTSASLGAVIENNEIENLPMNGREFLALGGLVPGVFTGTRPGDNPVPAKGDYVIGYNGARGDNNSFYMDGGANTSPQDNNMISSPSIDAIQEFRIETDMYSAKYGGAGGAVISVVTKSGTDQYHGALYEYHRDKALDALPYFYQGTRAALPNYLKNQFGGDIGGPIRKDKLFFFANAEFFPQRGSQEIVSFAPTAAERIGDVSGSLNPWSGKPTVLTNPYTGQVISSGILPQNLITPVGQALMALWPAPTPQYANDPFFNYRPFRPVSDNVHKYLGRIDWNISSRDSLAGIFNYGNYDTGVPGDINYGDQVAKQHDRTATVHWTHSYTPAMVGVTGMTWSYYDWGNDFRLNAKNYGAALGMDPSVNKINGMPFLMVFTQGSQYFSFGALAPNKNVTRQGQAYEDLSWQKGQHTLQMGGVFWRQKWDWQFFSGQSQYLSNLLDGLIPGDAGWSLFGITGSGFTDLLTGLYAEGVFGAGGGLATHFQRDTYALYIQDAWRVTPRLVLNYGLRWDYERPFQILDDKFGSLDPQTGLIRFAQGAPDLASVQFPHETGGSNFVYQGTAKTFAPRFGFAWQPFKDNKTVVRGGYGIFYTSEPASIEEGATFMNPFGPTVVPMKGGLGALGGVDHLTPYSEPPYGLNYERTNTPGCCGSFVARDFPRSYIQQWNLTLSRSFAKNIVGNLSYVGSRGVNLSGYQPQQSYNYDVYQKFQAAYPGTTPPPFFIKGYNSHYNAMQFSVRRNTGHGLTLMAAYTWSHSLADSSNTTYTENLASFAEEHGVPVYRRFQSNAGFDVRNRVSVASIYELPFGRGRKVGSSWNKYTDGILGGWNLSAIWTAQSGFPWSVLTGSNVLPDRVCNGNLPKSQRTTSQWFDYSCFVTHIDPTTGQPSAGDAGANVIYGPGLNNWDIGIHKRIPIRENKSFEIRLEGFNIWNHPQLLGPPAADWFNNTQSGAQITTARDQRQFQVAMRFDF